jgi:hypothetical protein
MAMAALSIRLARASVGGRRLAERGPDCIPRTFRAELTRKNSLFIVGINLMAAMRPKENFWGTFSCWLRLRKNVGGLVVSVKRMAMAPKAAILAESMRAAASEAELRPPELQAFISSLEAPFTNMSRS